MLVLYLIIQDNGNEVYDTAATEAVPSGFALLRPHFIAIRSPSISRPLAQASAARSAVLRSLKLMNAHLDGRR